MIRSFIVFIWLCAGLLSAGTAVCAAQVTNWSPAEALHLGERIYRDGMLPSGEPLRGLVQEDIPVSGNMFSCQSCHLRSGLGSVEGTVVTLPTHAAALFAPVVAPPPESSSANVPVVAAKGHGRTALSASAALQRPTAFASRPAYNDTTLAIAIRLGTDPAGRELSASMPRYQLEPEEMALLVNYLKNLSAAPSPGVDDSTLHIATVISADLPERQREALLATLRAYVAVRNGLEKPEQRGGMVNMFAAWEATRAYRRTQLHLWQLTGERAGWGAQLEEYYRQTPVFALVGGMVAGSWEPIHAFCEQNRLPCIFPLTDEPVVDGRDWYTLYFSRGHYQEGEAVARYLRARPQGGAGSRIVQIYRDDAAGRSLSRGFSNIWSGSDGLPPVHNLLLPSAPLDDAEVERLRQETAGTTVLLWLGSEALPLLEKWAATGPPSMAFLAGGQFGGQLPAVAEAARPFTWLSWPWRSPDEARRYQKKVRDWLLLHEVPVVDLAVQLKAYYLAGQFYNALMMMDGNYYRDYLLDTFDMLPDQVTASATYPRLSFGPGQRFAVKGCYIVQLSTGPSAPRVLFRGDWLVQ